MDWLTAYRVFNVPPGRYLVRYALPIVAVGLFVGVGLLRVLTGVPFAVRLVLLVALVVAAGWVAFLVPRIHADRRRKEIDDNIHFFITHMGVLATANLPPVEMLAKLGEKREYRALAHAAAQIASLVRSWNMGLPEACRFVAERTPSIIFSDFLERFAYALETGENLLVFLKSEQSVVIGDYATQYQANLYGVDSVKDMFMSTIMSVIFLVILILITPILTGLPLGGTAWAIVGMILFLEVVFLMLLMMRVPNDDLWTHISERVGLRKQMDTYLPLTLAFCLLAAIVAYRLLGDGQLPLVIAIAATPLGALGYKIASHETGIRRKDDNYPAFIRSLGASTAARGGGPKEVLKRLRRHDFGPLTKDVESLYRRLNLRLDDEGAWGRFANESGSNIIEKFTSMFIEGINSGGDAEEIGLIVSENVVKIVALRKHRHQTASSYRGMLFGLTAGMAASLYIGVGMLDVLINLFTGASDIEGTAATTGLALDIGSVDIGLMGVMVSGIMVAHILIAAYMQTTAAGGSKYRMAAFIPLFAWINAGAAWLTTVALNNVRL